MKLCLILNIRQQRANVPLLPSYLELLLLKIKLYFLKILLFLSSHSGSAFDFILASQFFFVDELECDWFFQNIFEWSTRWLVNAKYVRNEPSVGSKSRNFIRESPTISNEWLFGWVKRMSNRMDDHGRIIVLNFLSWATEFSLQTRRHRELTVSRF